MRRRTRGLLAALLGVALALVAVLGVVPCVALADGAVYDPASTYDGFGVLASSTDTVKIDGVKYNDEDVDWYVIGYDEIAKTVTLLSKQLLGTSAFGENNTYSGSTIETCVTGLTGEGRPLAGIVGALASISVTGDPDISGPAVPYLLSYDEAIALSFAKREASAGWWLRSPGTDVNPWMCDGGGMLSRWSPASDELGVRPALQLDLESVIFDSDAKTFELKPATHKVTPAASPAEGGTAEASPAEAAEGEKVTLTATATDGYEFVNWTLEGDGAKLDNADSATTTLTMGAADVIVTANFRKKAEPTPVAVPDASVTAHVQHIGWMDPVTDGTAAGTTGKSRRVEAVQIQLIGEDKDAYDVCYRVHVQRYGWMGWAKNGEEAGTQGMSRRAEAIQVVLVKKDAPAPDATYKGVTQQYAKAFVKK